MRTHFTSGGYRSVPATSGPAELPTVPVVEIIAHRGASRECPENTLAAFVRARELGADAVELDVHLTSDGELVVHHDAIPHSAPTLALEGRAIRSLSLAELRDFRVRGEPIPTLKEVMRAIGDDLVVYCELKGAGTAIAAAALLTNPKWRAAVHSFDHRMIAESRRLSPTLTRGVLQASYPVTPVAAMVSANARDIWQVSDLIDEPLVSAAHNRGGRVIAWTVDSTVEMARLVALQVDGICTNDVSLAKQLLRS